MQRRATPNAFGPRALFVGAAALLMLSHAASGQPRQDVEFQINQTTSLGQSVYVLGDLPELGGGDVTRALKLEPSQYPIWTVTVSLPAGREYSYQYYLRADAPASQRLVSNGTPIGQMLAGSTSPHPHTPAHQATVYLSTRAHPVLHWRIAGESGGFTGTPMLDIGPGRNVLERRWLALDVGQGGRGAEFFITNADGTGPEPSVGFYSTRLDAAHVQDGAIYAYTPAAQVPAQRKDYSPANPPSVFSTNLQQTRRYRVLLPRGYDAHPGRTYPVVYMHDGQNVFDVGPFGTWAADSAAAGMTATGRMRECIIVGIDNTSTRLNDYQPPEDGGRANAYTAFILEELMPVIDAQYRTLTGPANTGAIGSSMGGVVSLYMGWQFTGNFARVGALSGAWAVTQLDERVGGQAAPDVRLWIDSGDSGTANDNYWPTYTLRDNLLRTARPGGAMPLFGNLRHTVGFQQQHNEAAWASRIGEVFAYLFPAAEEDNPLRTLATGERFDADANGRVQIDDLYTQHQQTPLDVNADGTIDANDAHALRSVLRRGERASMTAAR
jgi:predicted alpha/beta superfamily hydrolase